MKRDIYSEDKGYTPSLDLFYKRKFSAKSSLEFNLVGTYMSSEYFRDLTDIYVNQGGKESVLHNETDGGKKSMIFEALYSKTGSKVNYSFGVRGSYSYTKNAIKILMYRDSNRWSSTPMRSLVVGVSGLLIVLVQELSSIIWITTGNPRRMFVTSRR